MSDNITTTTIKIDTNLYDDFKILNVKRKFYLKDLVERTMHLYVNDEEFRNKVYNYQVPQLSPTAQATTLTITGSNLI